MVILIRNPYSTSEGPLRYPYNTTENKDFLLVKAKKGGKWNFTLKGSLTVKNRLKYGSKYPITISHVFCSIKYDQI